MKIDNAKLNLAAQHIAQTRITEQSSLKTWVGERRPDFEGRSARQGMPQDQLTLSPQVRDAAPTRQCAKLDDDCEMDTVDSLKATIVKMMVKALTGRDFEIFDPSELAKAMSGGKLPVLEEVPQSLPDPRAGWGLEYDYYASHYEYESLSFSADGVINTADGQAINFSVSLNMTREFYSEQRVQVRAGDAKAIDPLVLNFGGKAAELTETRFNFDLDTDGRLDQIAWLGPQSAFLALDRNGDGAVNDGSELFGPRTGDGFAELAAWDEDGNRFIDAGDSIYDRLRLWMRGEDGSQQLLALGQKGVGAIYVGHLAAPFAVKDAQNALLANAVSAGFFLSESGEAGTVQQLDFTA